MSRLLRTTISQYAPLAVGDPFKRRSGSAIRNQSKESCHELLRGAAVHREVPLDAINYLADEQKAALEEKGAA